MSENRCAVTDLLIEQCAHCRPSTRNASIPPDPFDEPFDGPDEKIGPWFSARWPGECSECGEWFPVGEQIRADGESGYLAQCCGGKP